MDSKREIKNNGCTFQWKIENFSHCWHKKGEHMFSPVFAVKIKEETTEWKLALCPKGCSDGRFVGFYLHRAKDKSSEDKIRINYEFSFLSADLRTFHAVSCNWEFDKCRIAGIPKFMKREDLFTLKRALLLPQDTLTVCLNMWKEDGGSIENIQIYARTVIQIEQMNFTWVIKDFSSLEPDQKIPFVLKSFSKKVFATLNLFLTGRCGNEMICVEIIYSNKTMKLFTLHSCILNERGETVYNTYQEYCFDEFLNNEKCIFLLKKSNLMENKALYLPKNILSLKFECAATIGIAYEGIERTDLRHNSFDRNSNFQQKQSESSTLKDDLKSVLCDGFLSDMTLRTETDVFPVHKIILSARSPVFMKMFSSNMKEVRNKCVRIPDIDSGTLYQLLLYIYTDTIGDLTMDTASRLYEAADQYSVLPLKEKCSTFMKDNLCPSNACQILVIADLHQDANLKLTVQAYILENYHNIFNLRQWGELMVSNPKLTSETMFRMFVK